MTPAPPTATERAPATGVDAAPDTGAADALGLVFQTFNEIGIINQLASARFQRVMPGGMPLAQFTVLNHFVRLGGERTPAALARAFQVSKPAMTHTLQRLEAAGLIAVRPDPSDGRSKRVSITEAGRRAREAAIAALGPEAERILDEIAPEALTALLPALAEIRAVLDRQRDSLPGGGAPDG